MTRIVVQTKGDHVCADSTIYKNKYSPAYLLPNSAWDTIYKPFVAMIDLPYTYDPTDVDGLGRLDKFSQFFTDGHPLQIIPGILNEQNYHHFRFTSLVNFFFSLHEMELQDPHLVFDDIQYHASAFPVNTAFKIGSDPIKLIAKLTGVGCYVEPGDLYWLSKIIEKGLDTGIYKLGYGWEDIINLLRDFPYYGVTFLGEDSLAQIQVDYPNEQDYSGFFYRVSREYFPERRLDPATWNNSSHVLHSEDVFTINRHLNRYD